MKLTKCLLLAGLLGCAGCMNDSASRLPEDPAPKARVSARPRSGDDVPPAVAKLLPEAQLNEQNARSQAEVLGSVLLKEKSQLDGGESAMRGKGE
jgi:hypothetical protein